MDGQMFPGLSIIIIAIEYNNNNYFKKKIKSKFLTIGIVL